MYLRPTHARQGLLNIKIHDKCRGLRTMQRNMNQWKPEEENPANYKCDECGEGFLKPLLTTLSSSGRSQIYYACPRCLTKVNVVTHEHDEQQEEPRAEPQRLEPETTEELKCQHFFGYLKKRPKNMPVPDTCLTCDKMVECLVR
jgi:DNA-directed RNA polymerase subunit RPC12/RpoP